MSVIPMTSLFYKELILERKIWCWSLLWLRELRRVEIKPANFVIIIRLRRRSLTSQPAKAVLTSYNHHRNSSTRTFTFRIVRLHNESVLCVVKKPCYRVVVPICLCKESEFTARTFIDIVALWKKNLGKCFFSFVFVYVNVLINKRHTQNISMSVLQKSELGNVVKQKGVDVASTTGTIIITIIIIIIFFSMKKFCWQQC